ncbi:MAG: bifunctional alpha/beta hydrolase/OsmC family protein [Acidobacteriota bacterium]
MKSETITFEGALGHPLAARLDRPDDGQHVACALFAHCFTCGKDLKAVSRLSRALTARGIAVLRFDFTGLGESGGDFSETSFSSNVDDLLAAVEYLRHHHGAPQLLIGHSLGGTAVLQAAGRVDSCRAVVTIGAPSDTEHLVGTIFGGAEPTFDDDGAARVLLAGRPFRVGRELIDDLHHQRVLDAVQVLGRPLLVLHSPVDQTVGIDHARRIYDAAKHPKSFVSLDRADHLLLADPADARYVAEVITAWAGRYVGADDASTESAESTDAPLAHGEVEVVGGPSGFLQQVRTDAHRLVADEPARVGGADQGPNPYDFLLTALGTCTNMTLRMYADRKGWPLEGVETRMRHQKVHAKDCESCETESGKVDIIDRTVTIHGDDLDEAQRARLHEIADRCPVHRTLTSETVIRSEQG